MSRDDFDDEISSNATDKQTRLTRSASKRKQRHPPSKNPLNSISNFDHQAPSNQLLVVCPKMTGPKDWLAQANKLAFEAANSVYQESQFKAQTTSTNNNNNNKSRRKVDQHLPRTIVMTVRRSANKCQKNHRHSSKNRTSTKSRIKIRGALGSGGWASPTAYNAILLLSLMALLRPLQPEFVWSLRSNGQQQQAPESPGAPTSASSSSGIDASELKQQMELIRGASSVELGRSNVNSNGISNSNLIRAQRSESASGGAPTCGYPGSPAHASVSFNTSSVVTGTAASYTCDNGYELLGPPRRICQANGSWLPVGIPFCVLNVGLGKAAMQSSTAGQGSAQRAIDGSTSPYFQANTCTMTDAEQSPWWYVNLLEPYLVQIVRIDFGMACCAKGQKATIAVRVGNNRPDLGNNPLCNRYTGHIEEGKPLFLPCTRPAPGAFVSIHLESPSGSSLSICETFIYTDHALSIEQCPSFRDQPLGSTATYNGKCYLFHNNQALPFEGARKYCEQRGGSLVDETSPALQGFLSWELYRRHRNDQLMGQYWLGAVRDSRNQDNWKWINGKDVQITFWNSLQRQGNCSRFDGSKGWLWSDADCQQNLNFICQYRPLSCGKPEKPTNSTLITKNIDNGTVIEYQCAPGNMLMGPKSRTCLPTGFFSEFAPKCKYLDCQFPAHIPNGDYRLLNSSTAYQSVVTYYCQPGYQLYGRATLTCDVDERWNGPPPRCEPLLCPAPVPPTNGYVTVTSNVTVPGTQATYECRSGFELVGERHLACSLSGTWDHSFPYCRVDKRLSLNANTPASAPKVFFPQASPPNRVAQQATVGGLPVSNSTQSPQQQPAFFPSLPPPTNNNNKQQASLNGLPGQFIGASQAAVATLEPAPPANAVQQQQQQPSLASNSQPPSNEMVTQPNRRIPQVQYVQPSSTSELPPSVSPVADIAPATSTQTNSPSINSKPAKAQQPAYANRLQPSYNSGDLMINGNQGGQLATTNSISVHPSSSTTNPINTSPTVVGSIMASNSPAMNQPQQQGPTLISTSPPTSSSTTSFSTQSVMTPTQQLMANLPTSQSTPSSSQNPKEMVSSSSSPSLSTTQHQFVSQPHSHGHPTANGRQTNNHNGPSILASSTFGQPARSQNSLASTKYSLDGIIATAILGGFIFLGAVITIIVIVLRRRKNGHSPSIDAQTICTFDSNGGENNGFYRNYQQAWENLRFATAPGVQPKSSGSHPHLQHQHHQLASAAGLQHPLKSLNETMAQQAQLHHAHLVSNGLGVGGGGGSSQSSSLGGSGGAGSGSGSGNDPLIHHSRHQHHNGHHNSASNNNLTTNAYSNLHHASSHQIRAAQRRSLQLSASVGGAHHQMGLCSDDEDEQGVLSADESAIHRRQYRLSASTNAVDGHHLSGHQHHQHHAHHQYVHTNEGFRDSNELTVGPDTRSVNTNRGSRIFSVASGANNRLTTGNNHAHHNHHHHRHHHASGSQHQRLVSSSTATTTSSPSTSTRSSRASPQHSDDVDLDRLAYGNNWQQSANNQQQSSAAAANQQNGPGGGANI